MQNYIAQGKTTQRVVGISKHPVYNRLFVMIFVNSFGGRWNSSPRLTIAAVQTMNHLTSQINTIHLLGNSVLQLGHVSTDEMHQDKLLDFQAKKEQKNRRHSSNGNAMKCLYCGKRCHTEAEFFNQIRDKRKDHAERKKDNEQNLLVAYAGMIDRRKA